MNLSANARSNAPILTLGSVALAASILAVSTPLAAQTHGNKIPNDMAQCEPGKGPAVQVEISGLKSAEGNLFVRTYRARKSEWLKSKRYLTRVDTVPSRGTMSVCVPIPAAGAYAMTVQHDINGNRKKDLSADGAGMSNNPEIKTFLGIPRLPKVATTTFQAGTGITPISILVRYRD